MAAPLQTAPGSGDGRPRWRPRWTSPIRGLVDGSLSPDGSTFAWIDSLGRISWIDMATGKTLVRRPPLRGVDRLVVDNRGTVVAWTRLNPGRTSLAIVRPVEAPPLGRDLARPLWSVALDSTRQAVWVGTGDRALHWVPLDSGPMRRTELPGIPERLAANQGGVVAALWLESGICGLDSRGAIRWRMDGDHRARRWSPIVGVGGNQVYALSWRGPQRTEWRLTRVDTVSGRLQWELPIDGAEVSALCSADGERIAVATSQPARTPDGLGQRKLHMVGSDGKWLFRDKGSAVFQPVLAAVSVRGERITVVDGDRGISTLDRNGQTIARRIGLPGKRENGRPAQVEAVISSADGRRMLLLRADQRLTAYESLV